MSLRLADLIDERCVLLDLPVTSKEGLIHDAIEHLASADVTTSTEDALRAVLKREEVMSTGIGGGVAIPHAQCPGVEKLSVALVRPQAPVEFDSIDGRPVNLVFLILGPEERGGFVRVLARISRLLYDGDLQDRLLSVRSPHDAIQAIARKEESARA